MGIVIEKLFVKRGEDAVPYIKKYLINYHPAGYGTEIKDIKEVEEGIEIVFERWDSCD